MSTIASIPDSAEAHKHKLGTYAGVFTPSILTILGVIMFLRAGFVVAEAGIGQALLILLVADVIVLLTAFSIAAISTNTQVHGGGAYFLISRVLGPEFGGAIGIGLFLAQSLSVPFYILGFSEAMAQSFSAWQPDVRWICLITATILFGINYSGVRWAVKTQFIIQAILGLSIFAFLVGLGLKFDPAVFRENWPADYGPGRDFWIIFAIYFPAVTGIMAGINMSGDLKDPSRSLVRGTFWAIGVGFAIYAAQIILMGGAVARSDLRDSPYTMLILNALFGAGFLVVAGMFAATLSSALSSFLAAPRVMQAIARDRLLRPLNRLGKGTRKGDEPRRALIVTYAITLAILWLATAEDAGAAFNQVASVVTMLFLCTYLIINVAAFVEAFGSNPSFRPRFTWFHWTTALAGAIGCILAMGLIHLGHAALAVLAIAGLYAYMSRKSYATTFGDARRGFVYTNISKNLLRLRDIDPHAKNWRPTILVLSGNPNTRLNLILFGVWLEAGRGIVTVAHLIVGNLSALAGERQSAIRQLEQLLRDNDIQAFGEVLVTEDFDQGVSCLLQSHSIGPIKPNIVLMGWPADTGRIRPFVRHLGHVRSLGMSAVSVIDRGIPAMDRPGRIDIWWRGRENGSLMLILAHLLTRNWEWSRSSIRVLRVVPTEDERGPGETNMRDLVEAARITADVKVIVSRDAFRDVFQRTSRDAAVAFVGFHPAAEDQAEAFYTDFQALTKEMPTLILVSSSGEADLLA